MARQLQRLPSVRPGIAFLARGAAILAALVVVGIVSAMLGGKPWALVFQVFKATFGSSFGLEDLCLLVTPLILTGLAVAVGQQIGVWNIGAEGQFYMGAFCAAAVGLFVKLPDGWSLAAMALAGISGGMGWILVPTLARAYAEVNELITTLLLNFVALLIVYYVSTGPWHERGVMILGATPKIHAAIPALHGTVHWGIVVALGLAIATFVLFGLSRWGYEVRICGANPQAALYAGMPMRRRIVAVMLLSGAIAGAAGMIELTGTVHRLQGGISNNFGYLGIMVAVLARGSCLGVIATAALMAVILDSGIVLQTQGLTTSAVVAITGLILFFTAIGDEAARYRLVRIAPART